MKTFFSLLIKQILISYRNKVWCINKCKIENTHYCSEIIYDKNMLQKIENHLQIWEFDNNQLESNGNIV